MNLVQLCFDSAVDGRDVKRYMIFLKSVQYIYCIDLPRVPTVQTHAQREHMEWTAPPAAYVKTELSVHLWMDPAPVNQVSKGEDKEENRHCSTLVCFTIRGYDTS